MFRTSADLKYDTDERMTGGVMKIAYDRMNGVGDGMNVLHKCGYDDRHNCVALESPLSDTWCVKSVAMACIIQWPATI